MDNGKNNHSKKICPSCKSELGAPIASTNNSYIYSCDNCERGNKLKRIHDITFSPSSITTENPSCPSCKSNNTQKKGFRGTKQRYICLNCKRNWTEGGSLGKKIPLEDKIGKIKTAKEKQLAVKIKYKGFYRTIHPYASDETYCTAYCTYRGEIRTFRIDRMAEIEIKDKFDYDSSLESLAEGHIKRASFYKRDGY